MRSATIYLSGACNLRCKHCAVGKDHVKPREQLNTTKAMSVIENLCKSGVTNITLLGGEVTIYRSDLLEILKCGEKYGASFSINTNLSSYECIENCLSISSLKSIVISLDGVSAETHNKIRGRFQFEQTTENISRLMKHERVRSSSIKVELTFVVNGINRMEVMKAISFAKTLGVSKINFNHLALSGRATQFKNDLVLSDVDLVNSTSEIIVYWVLNKVVDMEFYIPPAFGYYLNSRFGLSLDIINWNACGGPIESYGYVDLQGNHLPCPAMSIEENPESGLKGNIATLDITSRKANEIWEEEIFKKFEDSRIKKIRNENMFPCNACRFKEQCSPCSAEVIKGAEDAEIPICRALFNVLKNSGDDFFNEVFEDTSQNNSLVPLANI